MRGVVAHYRKTEEGGGNTRRVHSNVDSKLKLVLSMELSNLAEGKNIERVLIACISLSWELEKPTVTIVFIVLFLHSRSDPSGTYPDPLSTPRDDGFVC